MSANFVPWPETCPDVPSDLQGWFNKGHEEFLEAKIWETQFPTVIELGTWKGRSAQWWLRHPGLILYCVDLWDPPTTYPNLVSSGLVLAKEEKVLEKCQRNLWEYRRRCSLIKGNTVDGLWLLHGLGVQPSLIYVDAGHDYVNVNADIVACRRLFPWAKLVGDDYPYPDVARAVDEAAKREAMTVERGGKHCWGLVPHGTRLPETYEREYGTLPVKGKVVFDWGADWGSTARWFLRRGALKVYASEIDPYDVERLELHAKVEPAIQPVMPITTRDVLEAVLDRVDVAKVDVEGAEELLLHVNVGYIQKVTHWVIETHSQELNEKLKALFERIGFRWRDIRTFKNPEVRVVEAVLS